jgi:hypothetical protein
MANDLTDRSNVVPTNIVPLKLTDLPAEARAEIERKKAKVEKILLSQLTMMRGGTVIKRDNSPPIIIDNNGVSSTPVSTPPPIAISPEDLSIMFGHYSKVYANMMDEKLDQALGKRSAVEPSTSAATNTAATAAATSSANPSTSLPVYGMPSNFYEG